MKEDLIDELKPEEHSDVEVPEDLRPKTEPAVFNFNFSKAIAPKLQSIPPG